MKKQFFVLSLLALSLVSILAQTDAPRDASSYPPGYYSGDPLPPSTIYLTFDDGPGDFTEEILDVLKAKNVKASFFINSFMRDLDKENRGHKNQLPAFKKALERLVDEGHLIGSHSFSHPDFTSLSTRQMIAELEILQKHLDEVLKDKSPRLKYFRPPWGSPWYGNWHSAAERKRVSSVLASRALVFNWTESWDSGDSLEWVKGEWYRRAHRRYNANSKEYADKVKRMLQRLLKQADGVQSGIVLMHDIHPTIRELLPQLIDQLRSRGYQFQSLEHYVRWRGLTLP